MAYDPDRLTFAKVAPGAQIGVSLVVGVSKVGQDSRDLIPVLGLSSVDLTDGYDVGQDGELSIDPLTGSASFAERLHPKPGDTVEGYAAQHGMYTGDNWELRYGSAILAQGTVLRVETGVSTDGPYWVKKTQYTLGGAASRMLDATASWDWLPQEGSLIRLKRFFTVDTSQCSGAQLAYLDQQCTAPGSNDGSAKLLDLARGFTAQTKFPVRTSNINLAGLTVVPAVKYKGVDPPALRMPHARLWTLSAEFLSDTGKPGSGPPPEKLQTVDVLKNYDAFIAGISQQDLAGGRLGISFVLGETMLGAGAFQVDTGVRAPAVIDFFGTRRVVSQINHSFTSKQYRCSLDLVVPTEVK